MAFKKGKSGNAKGRPKGTTTRPQIRDYFTDADILELVATAKEKAKEGNDAMLKTLLEQIFGKPAQALEMTGKDGQPIRIEISETIAKKNGL